VTTENKAPTDESLYITSIPAKTDAGTYYVWYKVNSDDNHTESTTSAPVTVTISPVNKAALSEAISAAEAYYDEIKGNADYAAIAETLKEAIDAAKALAGNDNATEGQSFNTLTPFSHPISKTQRFLPFAQVLCGAQAGMNAVPDTDDVNKKHGQPPFQYVIMVLQKNQQRRLPP